MVYLPRIARIVRPLAAVAMMAMMFVANVGAQDCHQDKEIDPSTYDAIVSAATRYLQMASRGDVAGIRQASMPVLSNAFAGVEQSVAQYKDGLAGTPTTHHVYLLDASNYTGDRAEFFCGVYGAAGHTARSTGFSIPGLPQGKYALIVQEVTASKGPYMLTQILQQQGGQWKIAGFYLKPMTVNGKNAQWFVDQAQQYKAKGNNTIAYLYYYMAWDLVSPVNFISTQTLDRLSQLMQEVRTPEIPGEQPVTLTAGARTYSLTQVFPLADNDKLALIVKWQAPDVNDTAKLFQENTALMKVLLQKNPDIRMAFQQVVARAVSPGGQDYGTALPVNEIK